MFRKSHYATLAFAAVLTVALIEPALAGGDTTFQSVSDLVKDWMEGTLGKLFAFGALGTGLATTIVRQSLMPVVVGVGVAVTAYYGPGILDTVVAATI